MKTYKIIIFTTLIIAIYFINANTPLMWEDIIYTLKADKTLAMAMNDASITHCNQLTNYDTVSDITGLTESTINHYNYANGRLFPHLTSQIFGPIIGKPVFNLFNTAMLLLFAYVISIFVICNYKQKFYYWCISFFCVWYMMHQTNSCFFLMTYALNYLWSSVLCLAFLYMYMYKMHIINNKWKLLLFCLFSFGVGWSHEGMVVGIAGAVFIDSIIRWKRKRLDYKRVLPAIFFCIGAAFLCLAPGNFNRTEAALPLYNHLLSFARLRIFYIMVIAFFLFSRSRRFILSNRMIIFALIIQMMFMFYVAFRNPRVLWGTELYSLLLLLMILSRKKWWSKTLPYSAVFASSILVLHIVYLSYTSFILKRQYDDIISLYQKNSNGIVTYNVIKVSPIVSDYIMTPFCEDRLFENMTFSVYYSKGMKDLKIKEDE